MRLLNPISKWQAYLALGLLCLGLSGCQRQAGSGELATLILHNGKITTLASASPSATAIAIRGDRILAAGTQQDLEKYRGPETKVVDLTGHTVIPGLNDSHVHVIRGGLNYNLELRWDGIPTLKEALARLREQVARTPKGEWVRVVGGWTAAQFAEKRMPTLRELNEAAPDTPVFVLHLYDRAFLNKAALHAVGYDKEIPAFPAGEVQKDAAGNPTGLLIAKPNANVLYSTLARGPKLSPEDRVNSTLQFMRELNRLGVTSANDPAGGFQNYPDDYKTIGDLARQKALTLRIAYSLFPQRPGKELEDFTSWGSMVKPGDGDAFYRMNGAGEMIVYSAADFEDFQEPRPELPPQMEAQFEAVLRETSKHNWPFRIHATYGESITRMLNVIEKLRKENVLAQVRWAIDHAEGITDEEIQRIKMLGGGVAVQHRMAYQGEFFKARYGPNLSQHAPPVRKLLESGVPVGLGTDATRVASYNPWVALYWLVSGKTVGGTVIYPPDQRLKRDEALRLMTVGSAWFSGEENVKGTLEPGKLADLAVLSSDYSSMAEEDLKTLTSVLTIVGGNAVYGAGEFASLAPTAPAVMPEWSPVAKFGGYYAASGKRDLPVEARRIP